MTAGCELPDWLPSKIVYTGNWTIFSNVAYTVFKRDWLVKPRPEFDGLVVLPNKSIVEGGREEGFWHLITRKDAKDGERYPEIKRAEKLTWARPVVEHRGDPGVTVFDYEEGNGRIRSYIWAQAFDYVVILEKKQRVAFLITAYDVDNDATRKDLERKYKKRIQRP